MAPAPEGGRRHWSCRGLCAPWSFVVIVGQSDTNFSHPYVLHYPGNGYPTDLPRPQLNTYTLQTYSNGVVFDNEMWGANFGILS